MELTVRLNTAQLARVEKEFRWIPGAAPKAICAALNKAVPGMRTDAVREVTAVYTVKAGDARKTMRIRKATRAKLEAALVSSGPAIALAKFRVSPKRTAGKRPRGGLRVQVRKGSGGRLGSGFMAAMGTGHVGVFTRAQSSRLPIKERFGPAVPSMLKDEGAFAGIQEKADARLTKALDGAVDGMLSGRF